MQTKTAYNLLQAHTEILKIFKHAINLPQEDFQIFHLTGRQQFMHVNTNL